MLLHFAQPFTTGSYYFGVSRMVFVIGVNLRQREAIFASSVNIMTNIKSPICLKRLCKLKIFAKSSFFYDFVFLFCSHVLVSDVKNFNL